MGVRSPDGRRFQERARGGDGRVAVAVEAALENDGGDLLRRVPGAEGQHRD